MTSEPGHSDTRALYPRLLGDAWAALPRAFRELHGRGDGQAGGLFDVRWSTNPLLRLVARLCGLPRPGERVRVGLRVCSDARGETWQRSFDGRALVTRQWAEQGLLVERALAGVELRFELGVRTGVLHFVQRRATQCLGPLRLPLPAALGPRVSARVSGDAERVSVEVELFGPFGAFLCRYAGLLELPGSRA